MLFLGLPLFAEDTGQPDSGVKKIHVIFTGGHDTDPRDRGRPVILIAAALKVTPEVFRQAFSGVHPAPPGQNGPTDAEARANKQVLMAALGPYGVTDERLNQVSNYYRYRRDRGQMWPVVPAEAYAIVKDGAVTGFVVDKGGSGYSSPPNVVLEEMPGVKATATLSFDTDFAKNGAVKEITVGSPAK